MVVCREEWEAAQWQRQWRGRRGERHRSGQDARWECGARSGNGNGGGGAVVGTVVAGGVSEPVRGCATTHLANSETADR